MLKARIKWEGDIHVIDRQRKERECVCVMIEMIEIDRDISTEREETKLL